METPKYQHDCDQCQFLGHYNDRDLYVCARNGMIDTVIARFSSDPPDYSSGLIFALGYRRGTAKSSNSKCLQEALTRAEALGLTYDKHLYGED